VSNGLVGPVLNLELWLNCEVDLPKGYFWGFPSLRDFRDRVTPDDKSPKVIPVL
jgi:hypothetical protein